MIQVLKSWESIKTNIKIRIDCEMTGCVDVNVDQMAPERTGVGKVIKIIPHLDFVQGRK
jgi:hypothetical protein